MTGWRIIAAAAILVSLALIAAAALGLVDWQTVVSIQSGMMCIVITTSLISLLRSSGNDDR
jgi:hypothetical protein